MLQNVKLGLQRTAIASNSTPMLFIIPHKQQHSEIVFLVSLYSQNYKLKNPLRLELEKSTSGIVVSDPKSGAYGVGHSEKEALEDFQSMFVEIFEQLSEQEQNLSHVLSDKLSFLRSVISPK
jgi:hypothetical protein